MDSNPHSTVGDIADPLEPAIAFLMDAYGLGDQEAAAHLEAEDSLEAVGSVLRRDMPEKYAGAWVDMDDLSLHAAITDPSATHDVEAVAAAQGLHSYALEESEHLLRHLETVVERVVEAADLLRSTDLEGAGIAAWVDPEANAVQVIGETQGPPDSKEVNAVEEFVEQQGEEVKLDGVRRAATTTVGGEGCKPTVHPH